MKKNTKKYSTVLLAAILASLTLLHPVSAADTGLPAPLDKIDPVLQEKLDDMDDGDTVDVSVWLKDIDYQQVANDVTDKLETMRQSGKVSAQALLLPQDDLAAMSQSAQNNAVSAYSAEPVKGLDPSQVTAEDAQEFIETKREVTAQKYEEQNTRLYNSLFPKEKQSWFRTVQQEQPEVIYSCKYAPNVMLTLTKSQVESAARSADVEELYYYDNTVVPEDLQPEEPLALEASPQTAAASNISLTYQTITGVKDMRDRNGFTGKGVKIGILEGAVPDQNNPVFSHLIKENRFHVVYNLKNPDYGHATGVAAIMVGKTDDFSAIAPDAQLYCAGVLDAVTGAMHWKKGMELLIDAGVNVINVSFSLVGDSWGEYGDASKWLDHAIWEHNVSVCFASGNNTRILTGGMAYNAIVVGNIDDQKTNKLSDDKRMYESILGTLYESAYSTNAYLAYKPDIMAPGARAGTPVSPKSGDTHNGGTSHAAPIVTGIIAQLCEMQPYYKTMPVALKCILLAGAIKTQEMIDYDEDIILDNDVDSVKRGERMALCRMNGAGMVNVLHAADIFENLRTFYHPSFGAASKNLQFKLEAVGGKRVQICLNWIKCNIIPGPHDTTKPLDTPREHLKLSLYDSSGMLAYCSDDLYDTKQYIAFTPKKSAVYMMKIEKISDNNNGTPIALSWNQ